MGMRDRTKLMFAGELGAMLAEMPEFLYERTPGFL